MKKTRLKYAIIIWLVFFIPSFCFGQLEPPVNLPSAGSDGRISLDLKGMDVVEVLKTLAAKGELNIVVGSNVRGRVTMFLKDVDIREAFEIILAANNLASDVRGDIIYVMTEKDYQQLYGERYEDKKEARIFQLKYANVAETAKVLNQMKTKIGKIIADEASNTIVMIDAPKVVSRAADLIEKIDKPAKTVVFELNYAKAGDLKDKLQEMLTKGVGKMQIDERTNKIVVTDLESNIPKIEEVVTAFDTMPQQVLIEAKIMEITLDDHIQLGVDWEAVIRMLQKEITLKSDFKLAAAGSFIPGAEIIIGSFGSGDFAAMLQILKTVGDTNALASPRITVLNNEEAKILIGTSEPYATNTVTQGTSTTTTATSLTFLDIGVKLYVTPVINKDGFITMKVRPEVSSRSGWYTYGDPETKVPIVSTTHAETSVMMQDGATIIIGGLIKDERTETVNKVPLLGDIPFFGLAFKKTDKQVQKKELVIFLTPHVVSGNTDYTKVPISHPMGEKVFTTSDEPTFERRTPRMMDPTLFKKRLLDRPYKKRDEIKINVITSTPEEYFYAIKNRIMQNLTIPEKIREALSEGDRVRMSFVLYSGGSLSATPEVLESTNSLLDEPAIIAVEKTVPFPAFPLSIPDFEKEFILDITYEPYN